MRFKEIKKHKNYKHWTWNDPRSSCIVDINMKPKTTLLNEFYHFKIICNKKYCKKALCEQDECEHKLNYSSLIEDKKYDTFEECEDGIIVWFYDRRDTLYCPMW